MKTNQRDIGVELVTYMMPENTHKKTKKVRIYCCGIANVCGFKFFDKNQSLLFEVGFTGELANSKEIVIEENQQIIGVVVK